MDRSGGDPPSTSFAGPPSPMCEDFREGASRLAGAAGVMFGWAPEDFWRATPAELGALIEALRAEARPDGVDTATLARLKEQFPDG